MKINITAGNCLNKILENKYSNEIFVAFCESMITGVYYSKLFSQEFIKERAITHNISVKEYKENLKGFLDFLNNINLYTEVVLWFGDEPFCNENKKIVLQTLVEYNYLGKLILNIVEEETGKLIQTKIIR